MTFLAIILIIISLSKLLLSATLTEYDIYPPTSLHMSHLMYVALVKSLLSFDGLTGLICGLYILW